MRVFLVSSRSDWYGGEEQLRLLLAGLLESGHTARAIVPRGAASERRLIQEGLPVITFPGKGHSPRSAKALRAALRSADIVHANDPRALTALTLATFGRLRRRCVASRRVDFVPRAPWVYRAAAARVICVSRAIRDICVRAGVPAQSLRVVYDGVDPQRMAGGDRRRTRTHLGLSDGDLLVLSVASCKPSKGIDDLIHAAARVVPELPVYFVHAGAGPLLEAHRRLIGELSLGPRFRLLGYRHDVPDLFAAADVFVMPSRYEGLGSSVIDAMFVALPVIATDAGGLPELLGAHAGHPSTGNLVPAANPRALARALYETLVDLPAARARAELARQRALTTFTATAMVEATVAVYQELRARG